MAAPNVIVPRTATVGVTAPGHRTASVIVIVPLGADAPVRFTPAMNVSLWPWTTGFGEASTLTTLVTWADRERVEAETRRRLLPRTRKEPSGAVSVMRYV